MGHQRPKRPDPGTDIVEDAVDATDATDATRLAADEARSELVDDLLRSAEAAVRASAGAIEAEAARSAIDKIDPSLEKYRKVREP